MSGPSVSRAAGSGRRYVQLIASERVNRSSHEGVERLSDLLPVLAEIIIAGNWGDHPRGFSGKAPGRDCREGWHVLSFISEPRRIIAAKAWD